MSQILQFLKQAAPVFPSQKQTEEGEKRDVPEKVIEIANAIRRDNPAVTDEAAYRMAWAKYKGQEQGHPKEPVHKMQGKAPDPTGIRAKLRSYTKEHGEKASHGEHEVSSKEEVRLAKKAEEETEMETEPSPDQGQEEPTIPLVHSKGGTALVLSPDQIDQIHQVLLQEGKEPHGIMIILPKEGTGRSIHFNPIPASALEDHRQAEAILDAWEEAHGTEEGSVGEEGDGTEMEEQLSLPKPANFEVRDSLEQAKTSGFLVGLFADLQETSSMEKTANTNQIHGSGKGMANAIDLLIKGAGGYSLEDIFAALKNCNRVEMPGEGR